MHIAKVKEFYLKKYKCIYCDNPVHSSRHMLWECGQVWQFWNLIENFYSITVNMKILICGKNKKIKQYFVCVDVFYF